MSRSNGADLCTDSFVLSGIPSCSKWPINDFDTDPKAPTTTGTTLPNPSSFLPALMILLLLRFFLDKFRSQSGSWSELQSWALPSLFKTFSVLNNHSAGSLTLLDCPCNFNSLQSFTKYTTEGHNAVTNNKRERESRWNNPHPVSCFPGLHTLPYQPFDFVCSSYKLKRFRCQRTGGIES